MRALAGIVLVTVALVGCGDEAMTLADYRDAVSDLAAAHTEEVESLRATRLYQMEQAVRALVGRLEGDALEAAAVAETGRQSAGLFAAVADAVDRYAKDLGALDPPAPFRDRHREYVEALQTSTRELDVTLEALGSARSFDEIDAAIGGSTFNDTQARVDAACRNLQRMLADEGAPADLHCAPA